MQKCVLSDGHCGPDPRTRADAPRARLQALLGFRHTVKGLDGHDIVLSRTGPTQPGPSEEALFLRSVSINARTLAGYVDVVSGEGMPIYHLTGHGNLFVEYQVVLPPTLTPKQREGKSPHQGLYGRLILTPGNLRSAQAGFRIYAACK